MDCHASTVPVKAVTHLQINQLEEDAFALLKKQIEYDLQVLRVCKGEGHQSPEQDLLHEARVAGQALAGRLGHRTAAPGQVCTRLARLRELHNFINTTITKLGLDWDNTAWLSDDC